MSNLGDILSALMQQEGTLAAAVIDGNSGQVLGKTGSADGLDMAARINSGVLRPKLHGIKKLEIEEHIEDMAITTTDHYHLVTFIQTHPGFFIYTALARHAGNLGAARYAASHAQRQIQL
ncbi:MAG: hypothetical protein ACH34Y_03115 [Brachymonas sp.]